jgi:peptide deformylase
MTVRPIVKLPDPVLKKVSDPVERVDDELRGLVDDMLETMYDAPGIGLAAIQIGIPRRLLVIDLAKEDQPKNPHAFINPRSSGRAMTPRSTKKAAFQFRTFSTTSNARPR